MNLVEFTWVRNGTNITVPKSAREGVMQLARIEVGRKYICAFDGKQYFATVRRTSDTQVCVALGDVLNEDGDPGDPTERGGRFGEQWVAPDRIHEM
jgi:hypothetical protein